MIESLADIEALTLSCRSDDSREYVSEAILCYRSGAYRAAIVSIWIAVVFDLIQKIRELSLSGDAKAKKLEEKFETYIAQIDSGNDQGVKSALEFEREILAVSRNELQLLDHHQYTDLRRLAEDRHQCAHPSFKRVGEPYRPSPEQARLHLRNAISHVMSQGPVQGRAALKTLTTLVSSAYFPTDTSGALTQLRSSAFEKPSEGLINGFTDALIFGFFKQGDPLRLRQQTLAALAATIELHRAQVEGRIRKQLPKIIRDLPDKDMLTGAALVARLPIAWSLLDLSSRERLSTYIRTGALDEVLKTFRRLYDIEDLRPIIDERISQLTAEQLGAAVSRFGLGKPAKERALCLLSRSQSWDQSNQIIEQGIRPIFSHITADDMRRIIRMPTETKADLIGAGAYGTLIDEARRTSLLGDVELNSLLKANRANYLVPDQDESGL